jgi:O-acetyl-ADP-ribose deacetylase (regulator of RNase III)
MITYRTGDLLDQPDIDVIVHQANLEHTFGAGIARAIKQKFPYAYVADLSTPFNDSNKLGTYSIGRYPANPALYPTVVNMYSQTSLYPSHTSYDAMYEALTSLRAHLEPLGIFRTIGFPYMIGCGLADGVWEIVKVIIEQAFEGSGIEVVIVKLPQV